jgi:hypothetical protein
MIRVGIAGFKGIQDMRTRFGDWLDPFDNDKDKLIVAHIRGNPVAYLMARPVIWVHGFNVAPEFDKRVQTRATEALLNWSLGWGPAAPRLPQGCLFQIDQANDRMETIANSLGGIEEEGSRLFRLDL